MRTLLPFAAFALLATLGACGDVVDPDPSDSSGTPDDNDGDGVAAADDCDDADAAVHPGATEVCDSLDNDCDGATDEDGPIRYADSDGDGHGDVNTAQATCDAPAGTVDNATVIPRMASMSTTTAPPVPRWPTSTSSSAARAAPNPQRGCRPGTSTTTAMTTCW